MIGFSFRFPQLKNATKHITSSYGMVAIVASLAVTPAAYAQDVDINAETVAVRIDVAGRQRMLSQRMAKSFCYARSGVDVLENARVLSTARDLYMMSHESFAYGNVEMKIFTEQDDAAFSAWEQIDTLWSRLTQIYGSALTGEVIGEDQFAEATELSLQVMSANNDYVAYLRQAYADYISGGTGSAILIDLYGRQRMLSQKMSKEVCLAAAGYDLDKTRAELQATFKLFDGSINAFIDGLPIAGVPPAPTPQIDEQLRLARDYWIPVRSIAADVAAGNAVGLSDLAKFNRAMDSFLPEMNKAVGMLAAMQADKPS